MSKYCITAARPKDADHDLKSEFKLWRYEERPTGWVWSLKGWRSGGKIAALLEAGHEVLTAKLIGKTMSLGASVEMEFRISRNDTQYKIGDMPDE